MLDTYASKLVPAKTTRLLHNQLFCLTKLLVVFCSLRRCHQLYQQRQSLVEKIFNQFDREKITRFYVQMACKQIRQPRNYPCLKLKHFLLEKDSKVGHTDQFQKTYMVEFLVQVKFKRESRNDLKSTWPFPLFDGLQNNLRLILQQEHDFSQSERASGRVQTYFEMAGCDWISQRDD